MLWGEAAARVWTSSGAVITQWRTPCRNRLTPAVLTAFEQDSTLIAVIEMSQSKWLVAAVIPGVERQPLKKLDADAGALLKLLQRWREEARKAGREVKRIVCAYEAGRTDSGWRAGCRPTPSRPTSSMHEHSGVREHRRAKSDRIDTELLMRSFLGWLRGEKRHCSMVAIPTMAEEDARRPSRERENLVGEQTRIVNRVKAILALFGIGGFNPRLRKAVQKLEMLHTAEERRSRKMPRRSCATTWSGCAWSTTRSVPSKTNVCAGCSSTRTATGPHAMVRLIARVLGIGIETADMLVMRC